MAGRCQVFGETSTRFVYINHTAAVTQCNVALPRRWIKLYFQSKSPWCIISYTNMTFSVCMPALTCLCLTEIFTTWVCGWLYWLCKMQGVRARPYGGHLPHSLIYISYCYVTWWPASCKTRKLRLAKVSMPFPIYLYIAVSVIGWGREATDSYMDRQ